MLTFPCSQMLRMAPLSLRRITPRSVHRFLPIWTISHSMSTSVPTGAGRMYVTLSVRETPMNLQKPGLEIRASGSVVHQSKMVAAQPPCRFCRRLQLSGWTVKEKTTLGWGMASDTDTISRCGTRGAAQS